jgi:hypothetical protein
LPTLLQFQRNTGKTPQALKNMPILHPCLEELIQHFNTLSSSRTYFSELTPTKNGGFASSVKPNPLAISTILDYNQRIAKVLKDSDFLDIMQTLDRLFVHNAFKRKA